MKNNATVKNDIKAMLELASTESGISYMDLLNDISTIQDIANDLNITTPQAIELTNELLKELEEETKKESILDAIISNCIEECSSKFNKELKNKDDINKIDLFWLEQMKLEVSNTIIRVKEFNKL